MTEESLQQDTIKHSTKINYLFPLRSKCCNTGIMAMCLFLSNILKKPVLYKDSTMGKSLSFFFFLKELYNGYKRDLFYFYFYFFGFK